MVRSPPLPTKAKATETPTASTITPAPRPALDKWEIVPWNGAINDDASSKGLPPKQLPEELGDCVVVARVRDGPTSVPRLDATDASADS
jgi:hypothetical protein